MPDNIIITLDKEDFKMTKEVLARDQEIMNHWVDGDYVEDYKKDQYGKGR